MKSLPTRLRSPPRQSPFTRWWARVARPTLTSHIQNPAKHGSAWTGRRPVPTRARIVLAICSRLTSDDRRRLLRRFDQLQLAVASAVQDQHFTLGIAEDEYITVAEVGFFDRFLESHRTLGNSFVGADQMHFSGLGYRGKFVDDVMPVRYTLLLESRPTPRT